MSSVFPVLIVLLSSQTSCRVGQVTSRNYVYFMEDVTAISIAYSHGSPSRLQIVQRGHEALLLLQLVQMLKGSEWLRESKFGVGLKVAWKLHGPFVRGLDGSSCSGDQLWHQLEATSTTSF